MGYLIFNTDREDEMEGLRSRMRRNYRRDYPSMRGDVSMREHYYKKGYEHAMEDMEDEEERYRRQRDGRGRFV